MMKNRRIIVKLVIALVAMIVVVATKHLVRRYAVNMSRYVALDRSEYEMVEKLLNNS